MVWARESQHSNDDDRLAERFTETPRARAARIARKRIDPSTRRAVLDLLKGDTMTTTPAKNRAAVALGRKGGSVTSEAKARAARLNGRKGGRPRKVLDVLPTRDGVTLRFRTAKSKGAK